MTDIRDDMLRDSSPELVALLREEIERDGRITFARFMELSLTHPKHGYYASGAQRAGFEGDFLTGPETHRIFGHALARQVAEQKHGIAARAQLARQRAPDAAGAAEHDRLQARSPNSRTDWALRNRRPGSHLSRCAKKRGSRGSIAAKCSARVKRSLVR